MTSGHALRQLDSEMTRVRERCDVCERELTRLAAERAAHQEIEVRARPRLLLLIRNARS